MHLLDGYYNFLVGAHEYAGGGTALVSGGKLIGTELTGSVT